MSNELHGSFAALWEEIARLYFLTGGSEMVIPNAVGPKVVYDTFRDRYHLNQSEIESLTGFSPARQKQLRESIRPSRNLPSRSPLIKALSKWRDLGLPDEIDILHKTSGQPSLAALMGGAWSDNPRVKGAAKLLIRLGAAVSAPNDRIKLVRDGELFNENYLVVAELQVNRLTQIMGDLCKQLEGQLAESLPLNSRNRTAGKM